MTNSYFQLLKPLKMGDMILKNRIIMAPLTRCRAFDRIPNELMLEYYCQRASAGLILTEATSIHPMGVGYPRTPGIWSDEQIAGWKKITQALHQKDGKIFCQLWHVGRISHPFYLDGKLPLAPSPVAAIGNVSLVRPPIAYPVPRALEMAEIKEIVAQYKKAASNAFQSNFDGVEIHAANGYLIDQFLQDSTNHRTDEYGGSVSNRCRFLMEIVDAAIEVWGASKVGVHLAPRCDSHSMGDSNAKELFTYIARELSIKKIAFIFTRESLKEPRLSPLMRKEFQGIFIANEGHDFESANLLLERNEADAVAFGKYFISNPDLPFKIEKNISPTPFQSETFYGETNVGYTDYPVHKI